MHKKLILIAAIIHSSTALSSTCKPPSFLDKIKDADYIFSGIVVSREKDLPIENYKNEHELCGSKYATIKLFNSWKGELNDEVKVYSEDACGFLGTYFETNEHYLIFATQNKDNLPYLDDIGACYTDSLIQSIQNKTVLKLDKKFQSNSVFSNAELIGTWESYGNKNDKVFKGVDSLMLNFKNKFKFNGKTYYKNKATKYKGRFYAKEGSLFILDEDGPQSYNYSVKNNELIITSDDAEIKYYLKKT